MTARYALYNTALLRDRFSLPNGLPKGIKIRYNISPTQINPVIVERDGVRVAETMLWGLLPSNAKNMNSVFRHHTYNVRSELIFDKVSTATAIREQRCLIPVDGFYEWKKIPNDKQAYYISRSDKAVFSLAGVYSSWKDGEGNLQSTYSIITTEPNHDLESVTDRMPVVIHPDDEKTWLSPDVYDANTLYDIMRPCPEGVLTITKVGPAINSAKQDNAKLIVPQV